jgi:hypothetical protein
MKLESLDPVLPKALEHYSELLADAYLDSTVAAVGAVSDRQSQPGSEKNICHVLRPRFITRTQERAVNDAALAVFRALKHVQARLLADDALLAALPVEPGYLDLIRHTAATPSGVMGRIDAFAGAGGDVGFMEFNPNPGGAFYFDMIADAFENAPIMQAFRERFPFESYRLSARMPSALGAAYARHGGQGAPRIALVFGDGEATDGAPASHHFEQSLEGQRLVAMLTKLGMPPVIAAPADFAYSTRDGLSARGNPVDAVFVENWRAWLDLPAAHPLFVAVRERKAWLMNAVADKVLLGNKAIFALLSDPESGCALPADLRAAVDRHVPWTRLFRPVMTTFHGRRVDLLPTVAADKDRFVLKPADGWGGAQVVLGSDCSAAQWQAAMEAALQQPFVVQEKIEAVPESFPLLEEGGLAFHDHYVDLNPYIWSETTAHGMGARASRIAVTNFKQGASLLPVFVLR